jgi:hypothetical protein
MKSICFFNNFHNGDLFASKSFVKEIIDSVDTKFYYGHMNHPSVFSDLNAEYLYFPQIENEVKFLNTEDIFYVNTWIGSYFDEAPADECCTLKFSYDMFEKIYFKLNETFSLNLKLSSIENYFPSIDFSKYQTGNIDEYIQKDLNKKVLFCNGPSMSGQCLYTGDMKPVIESLANKHSNISFLCTQRFDTILSNIKFTSDIIKIEECDLNEIGYLSTFCDIIVGRNSGPHCFTANDLNVKNPNKSFYAFGQDPRVCLYYNIDLECKFVYEVFDNLKNVESSIEELILKS